MFLTILNILVFLSLIEIAISNNHHLFSELRNIYIILLQQNASLWLLMSTHLLRSLPCFLDRRFGRVLDGELKACQQVANQTGVLVDPIYTLAAWELAVHLSQREHKDDRKVVMLHTGGTLGMFGLAQRFKSYFSKLKDRQPSEI